MAPSKLNLDKIKHMQSTNPEGRMQWWAYCDASETREGFGGDRDPMRRSDEFIEQFLAEFTSGFRREVPQKALNAEKRKKEREEAENRQFNPAFVDYMAQKMEAEGGDYDENDPMAMMQMLTTMTAMLPVGSGPKELGILMTQMKAQMGGKISGASASANKTSMPSADWQPGAQQQQWQAPMDPDDWQCPICKEVRQGESCWKCNSMAPAGHSSWGAVGGGASSARSSPYGDFSNDWT